MKKESLYNLFGDIDDELVEQAASYAPPRRKRTAARRLSAAAACLAVAAGLALLVPRLLRRDAPPYQGPTYSSLDEIPVERSGQYWLNGVAGGPIELWESGGNLYFSLMTRWVSDDARQETVTYETVFRVNTGDHSYTAVSEEARSFSLRDGRFIYTRSAEYLTAENRWTVPYYTNSLDWNDEKPISGDKARQLLNTDRHTAVIDGKATVYTAEFSDGSVRLRLDSGETRSVLLPLHAFLGADKTALGFNRLVGISHDKLYFIANYADKNGDSLREDLFVIGLDGEDLRMITHEKATGSIGWYTEPDANGNIWFLYRGNPSTILWLDTMTDRAEAVAQVDGYAWQFVRNDSHFLCIVEDSPSVPGELRLIPY